MRKCPWPTHSWSGNGTEFLMGWLERNCPWGLALEEKGHMRLPLCIKNPKEFESEPGEGLGHPSSKHVLSFLSLKTTVWLGSSPTCSWPSFSKATHRCPSLLVCALPRIERGALCILVKHSTNFGISLEKAQGQTPGASRPRPW